MTLPKDAVHLEIVIPRADLEELPAAPQRRRADAKPGLPPPPAASEGQEDPGEAARPPRPRGARSGRHVAWLRHGRQAPRAEGGSLAVDRARRDDARQGGRAPTRCAM